MCSRHALIPVAAVLIVVTAGCLGFGGPSFRPLPDRPGELTAESTREYAWTYERRLVQNNLIQEVSGLRNVSFDRQRLQANRSADGYWVHIEYTLAYRTGGNTTAVNRTVNYFVNDTQTRRAVATGFVRPGPDPRNGTVVERDVNTADPERTVPVRTTTNATNRAR